jgi:hypothetical protein
MNKAQYKAQASQARKAEKCNAVEKAINRNARKEFARVAPALRSLAKQVRREVAAMLAPKIASEDALMAL